MSNPEQLHHLPLRRVALVRRVMAYGTPSEYVVVIDNSFSRGAMPDLDVAHSERLAPATGHFRQIHLVAARVLVGAVLSQIALGVIALPVHKWTGLVVGVLSLIVAIAGVRGRFSRSTVGLSLASVVLVGFQGMLIALADTLSVLGIVHLVDGFIIFGISIVIAIESEDEGRTETPGPTVTP